eukprot:m.106306 g.106306  ORF g.106306 m.106306 type:complete len:345 (-) comp8944_c0_seq1:105-1139(-)
MTDMTARTQLGGCGAHLDVEAAAQIVVDPLGARLADEAEAGKVVHRAVQDVAEVFELAAEQDQAGGHVADGGHAHQKRIRLGGLGREVLRPARVRAVALDRLAAGQGGQLLRADLCVLREDDRDLQAQERCDEGAVVVRPRLGRGLRGLGAIRLEQDDRAAVHGHKAVQLRGARRVLEECRHVLVADAQDADARAALVVAVPQPDDVRVQPGVPQPGEHQRVGRHLLRVDIDDQRACDRYLARRGGCLRGGRIRGRGGRIRGCRGRIRGCGGRIRGRERSRGCRAGGCRCGRGASRRCWGGTRAGGGCGRGRLRATRRRGGRSGRTGTRRRRGASTCGHGGACA